MYSIIERCRICGNGDLAEVLNLGSQFLTGVFPRSASEKITSGPLELVKCHGDAGCGLVQLRQSYDPSEMYGANYGYRSSLNESMVNHLRAKVKGLLTKVPIGKGDLVLDIGSNDGTLLSFYPDTATVAGMDPTAEKFRHFYKPHIQAIADFFSEKSFVAHFGGRKAKIVTSIAMFYDLEAPMNFVRQVASILDDEGIWHFEQSYMLRMLGVNAYDTICHEHVEYYALGQIKWMTDRCGLKIIDVELNELNGGSFAVTVARAGSSYPVNEEAVSRILGDEKRLGLDTMKPFVEFRERVFAHRDELRALIERLKTEKAAVLGYGASTKGNVILQFCGFGPADLPAIAEVNEEKFGRVTPGSNIPIISEAQAHAMKPDYLLVLPWHFRENLLRREREYLASGGRMIFPLPRIEVFAE